MKIAVVGNRDGWTKEEVFQALHDNNVTREDIIISGGAIGVDTYAQEYAKANGIQMRILYPNPKEPSPDRYFDRNELIAIMCDIMIAFDKNHEHSGTKNAIHHAEKLDKDVILIDKNDKKDIVTTET